MGVKGLTCLVETKFTEVKKNVSIQKLAQEHRRLTATDKAVLLVDGYSIVEILYGDLDWICGGQWLQFSEKIQDFACRFREIGVTLVFIFDGSVPDDKLHTWIERRNSNNWKIKQLFEKMRDAGDEQTRKSIISNEKPMLHGRGGFLAECVRYLCGCQVLFSYEDPDKEIALFAKHESSCFAIMSNDSDFLIFDTKPYISVRDINLSDMTTIMYDRNVLLKCLNLPTISYLPYYACLMGNDIVSSESLLTFHRRIGGYTWKDYFVRSSKICRELPRLKFLAYEELARYVFGSERKSNAACIKNGISSYLLSSDSQCVKLYRNVYPVIKNVEGLNISASLWRKITFACIKFDLSTEIYTVLRFKVYRSIESVEYAEAYGFSGSLFEKVRRRAYYILFKHLVKEGRDGVPNVYIQELVSEANQKLNQTSYIKPLKLREIDHVPDLDYILFGTDYDTKLNLFLSCFDIPWSWKNELEKLPRGLQYFCCIAKYLFDCCSTASFKQFEKESLVAQAVKIKTSEFSHAINPVLEDIKPLSFGGLFARAYLFGVFAHSVCGKPLGQAPSRYFDGKSFNFFYSSLKAGGELLLNQDELKTFDLVMQVCNYQPVKPQLTLLNIQSRY